MPLFGGINGPAVSHSFLLYAIARDGVAGQLEADEVRHHAAAGEVAASLIVVASQVGKPANRSPLHGDASGTDRIGADILVKRRADEIRNDADRTRRRGD